MWQNYGNKQFKMFQKELLLMKVLRKMFIWIRCAKRLSEMECLKNNHIEDDLKRLERHVDNLYSYPPEMVNEIENRLYNVGWRNFKKLDVISILNTTKLTLEEKKKLLEKRLYQGKISPKRLQDSQKRLQGN